MPYPELYLDIPGQPELAVIPEYPGITQSTNLVLGYPSLEILKWDIPGYPWISLAGTTWYKTGYAGISLHVIEG